MVLSIGAAPKEHIGHCVPPPTKLIKHLNKIICRL